MDAWLAGAHCYYWKLAAETMKLVVVYNTHAGGKLSREHLSERFKAGGHTVEEFIPLDDNLSSNLLPHIKKEATIVAVGGDGTQNAVVNCMAGTKAVLVPLAGGTLNHFVKDLGGELDVDRAIERLATTAIRKVDVGQINDRLFINNSSLGLYPTSLRVRSKWEDKLGKWPAAVFAVALVLFHFRLYDVTIANKTITTPFIFIGNNIYRPDKLGVVRRDRLNEGVLSVFIAKTTSRWALLKLAFFAVFGKTDRIPGLELYRLLSLTIKIKAKKRVRIAYDGELKEFSSSVRYGVRPKTLRVRV